MAYVRSYTTKQRKNGKPAKTYQVIWREQARDAKTGLPIPGQKRTRSEAYPTSEQAHERRDELNAAKHAGSNAVNSLAAQRKAGQLTFAHYAQAWLTSQQIKAASGKVKQATITGYQARLAVYALPQFGSNAIASITPAHCEQYLAALVQHDLAPATLKHHWSVLSAVFTYAVRHKAITSNPTLAVDFSVTSARNTRKNARHYPLTAEQVAAVAASIGERYPVYELLTLFAAYTGLRAEELAGLEVQDINLQNATINVRRAKKRQKGQWIVDTLKSAKSVRTVPLPPWLATRMADYLAGHPHGNHTSLNYNPQAPLWPNRALGGARRRGCRAIAPLDWTEPCDMGAYYKNLLRPALAANGLPASTPAKPPTATTPATPAIQGVRLHDLRHTFATLQLSAGVHFMQVSQWLGHSTYTLTLDVYGDYIPQDGGAGNGLPEPLLPAPASLASVLPLRRPQYLPENDSA
jgi:integrase